jgi:4-hydroxy-2-oxoheptanedioate aldolase
MIFDRCDRSSLAAFLVDFGTAPGCDQKQQQQDGAKHASEMETCMNVKRRDLLAAGVSAGIGMGLMTAAGPAAAQQGGGAGRGSGQSSRGGEGFSMGDPAANSGWQPSSVDLNYKPRRVNKVIELWEDGQPVYYTYSTGLGPGVDPYEQGKKMAKTYADCINYGLEHGPLDFTRFADFMRGLKDGGPTRSGHATPAVFVEPPCTGLNATYALSNAWIVGNFLDLGAHGVHICHARDPEAIQVYCQMAARFTCDYPDTPQVALQGMGLRGQPPGVAPEIWGVSPSKYMHIADVWPLNPRGEIMIGCKIEDKFADANKKQTLATPGLAFAEWGPTDNSQSLFGLAAYDENSTARFSLNRPLAQQAVLDKVRAEVLAECKKNNVRFLNSSSPDPKNPSYVITQIKDGAMLMGASEKVTQIGREYTKRKMPV